MVKRLTIATSATIIVAVAAIDLVEFAGGYNAFPILLGFFPASFFLLTLTLFAICVAVIVIFVALFRRQVRYALILIAVLIIGWLLSPRFLAHSAFLFGLAVRLRQLSSPAEIRRVAQTCLTLMPSGGRVFAPQKIMGPGSYEAEQSKRVWDAIGGHPFVHLDDERCVISVEPPEVTFEWGGTLPGYWGICVGRCRDDWARTQTIPFAEGMLLFRGD